MNLVRALQKVGPHFTRRRRRRRPESADASPSSRQVCAPTPTFGSGPI